jgi:hypothetical protein
MLCNNFQGNMLSEKLISKDCILYDLFTHIIKMTKIIEMENRVVIDSGQKWWGGEVKHGRKSDLLIKGQYVRDSSVDGTVLFFSVSRSVS